MKRIKKNKGSENLALLHMMSVMFMFGYQLKYLLL
jgi:hypothetical protein